MFNLGVLAVCFMANFPTFPSKVEGVVVVNFKSYITIQVKNRDSTETIEITFLKNKCKGK